MNDTARTENATIDTCPWCGEKIGGENRLLGNEFEDRNGDSYVIYFGCSKCITKPLHEFTPPNGFIDFRANKRAYDAIQEYRDAIINAERTAGRL